MGHLYTVLVVLALSGTVLGVTYYKGRLDGIAVEASRQEEAVRKLNEALHHRSIQLANLEAQRLEQTRKLEERVGQLQEEAREDPNADRPALGPGSVLRLNSLLED